MRIGMTAVAIALLLAPTGAVVGANMHEQSQAVEHHTTFVELVLNDGDRAPGFAALAGLVTCQPTSSMHNAVLWFNDQLLLRTGRQGPDSRCLEDRNATHVWAVEEGAPDPRDHPSIQPTGKVYEFTDPNNRHWVVREYVYHVIHAIRQETTQAGVSDVSVTVEGEAEVRAVPFYTWVVERKAATLDPTINHHYNFVTLVDFDKLLFGPDGETTHTGEPGDPRTGNSHNASDPGEEHRFPHDHETANIDLYVGQAPDVGPGQKEEGARTNVRVVTPDQVDGPGGKAGPLTVE